MRRCDGALLRDLSRTRWTEKEQHVTTNTIKFGLASLAYYYVMMAAEWAGKVRPSSGIISCYQRLDIKVLNSRGVGRNFLNVRHTRVILSRADASLKSAITLLIVIVI